MNNDQYTYLQNKKWRSITYDWNVLSTYDNSSKLYCLSDFQVAWLLSNTEYMRWATRWVDCPCTQNDLEAMKAELDYNLMTCVGTWDQLQYIANALNRQEIERLNSLWDGSLPSSVNPDAPDDFFTGDDSSDRIDALCTALSLWTYSWAIEWLAQAGIVLGIANITSQLASFIVPVGGQIVAQAIADLAAPLQAQVDALNNLSELDAVICDWNDALQGVAISASNWNSEVCGLSYAGGSDKDLIQQLLCSDTALLGNFLSFVDALGNGYELAQIGVSICPCAEPQQICFDFTDLTDLLVISGAIDAAFGDPQPSMEGIVSSVTGFPYDSTSDAAYRRVIAVQYEFPTNVTVTDVSFDRYSTTQASGQPNGIGVIGMEVQDEFDVTLFRNAPVSSIYQAWTTHAWNDLDLEDARKVTVWLFLNTNAASPSGNHWMDNFCIDYVG